MGKVASPSKGLSLLGAKPDKVFLVRGEKTQLRYEVHLWPARLPGNREILWPTFDLIRDYGIFRLSVDISVPLKDTEVVGIR